MPVRRVLIANRGEIAVRIARSCREMGCDVIAIYSTPDRNALHVQVADEAYWIGEAPALESYLDIAAVLGAARESGADAVHPGYGFLAENSAFAAAVQGAGMRWVGPPPHVVDLMGDKVASKNLARSAGVPVVPGYDGEDATTERMLAEADVIGYPVMVKASAGGGGKGMRAVQRREDLHAAIEGATREARSAFGDDRLFIEKLIVRPRHVEIQVMADEHGNAVYLGERDCSVQRRHQKVLEEAPSPAVIPELRARMGEAALRLVEAAGYVNAGTVEFLLDGQDFYFLEMNTRIQVEHPVTEMVTGLDLVRLQLAIAAGEKLPVRQDDVQLHGHAIEARIYAEDPDNNFLPSTGTLKTLSVPRGQGIRNDTGVFEGAEITPYYDPMIAKLIVHADDRTSAVAGLAAALAAYRVEGPTTNLPFLSWVVRQDEFKSGDFDIDFVARSWHGSALEPPPAALAAAAIVQVLGDALPLGDSPRDPHDVHSPWAISSAWRANGAWRPFRYCVYGNDYSVEVQKGQDGAWRVRSGGEEREMAAERGGPGVLVMRDGPRVVRCVVAATESGLSVDLDGSTYRLDLPSETNAAATRGGKHGAREGALAPMPGTVVKVSVEEGQKVRAHDPLLVLEAMKMEHVVEAPHDGIVRAINYKVGDMVPAGAGMVEIEAE